MGHPGRRIVHYGQQLDSADRSGTAPPSAGDTAIFNVGARAYTVNFNRDLTNEILEIVAGDVTFHSSGTDRRYSLSNEAVLDGGNLYLGVVGDPLDLSIRNDLRVRDGSRLDVLHGSEVDVLGQLRIGAHSSGDGTVIVDGAGSALTTSATNNAIIGDSGSEGMLTLNNSAQALFGGDLNIAASGVTGSSGTVNLNTGAEMTVDGDVNIVTGTNSNQPGFLNVNDNTTLIANGNLNIGTGTSTLQSAFLSVIGPGAVFAQMGAGTIDLGSAADPGNIARLDVNGGMFTSGTGAITVHPTGILDVAAGSFTANGPVTIENGGTLVIEGGDFEAKSGLDNSDDGTIDIRNGTLTISVGHFEATPPGSSTDGVFVVSGAAAGDLSKLSLTSGATGNFSHRLIVGSSGGTDGALEVVGGATLSIPSFSKIGGDNAGSTATVTVSGEGSQLTIGAVGTIGRKSTGTLDILDGGTVSTLGSIIVGTFSQGQGTITVEGEGSLMESSGFQNWVIGSAGTGRLYVRQGGELQAAGLLIGRELSGDGRVDLGSGTMLTVSGDVQVAGTGAATASGGVGVLFLLSANAEIGGTLKIWDTGDVTMFGSSPFLSADSIDNSTGGTFDFRSGTLEANNFIGDLVNQGGTLAPGPDAGPTAITGDYTQQADGTLAMEIGGSIPGGTHDVVTVSGVASLDGQLELSLINGFLPNPDDAMFLLSATTLNGFFDNVFTGQRLDVTGGEGSFVVNYGVGSDFPNNQIVLSDFLPSGPTFVTPDSFEVTQGDYVAGGLPELDESDNLDFSLRRRNGDLQSRTEFEVKSTSPTATPTTFEFTLEGSVFARGNVVQTIELFDYDLGAWELVDSSDARRAPAPDSVVSVAATGDLSRFVETGTMCIEARIRYRSDANRQKFASNTDQVVWTIE